VPAGRHLAGRHQFRHGHGPACVSPGDTASAAGSLERVPGDCHSAGVIRIPHPTGWLGLGRVLHRADQRHPHRAVAGRLAGGDGGIPEYLFCGSRFLPAQQSGHHGDPRDPACGGQYDGQSFQQRRISFRIPAVHAVWDFRNDFFTSVFPYVHRAHPDRLY